MLKILPDYAEIMPENFTKKTNTINVIMLDLSQKGQIMPELC